MRARNPLAYALAFLSTLSAAPAASGPSGRIDYALCYYPPSRALVMHGGWGPDGKWSPMSEMWKLDATGWQSMAAQGSPALAHHAMVFDQSRQVLVLCGQAQMMSSGHDIWEFSQGAWTKVYSLPGSGFGDAELAYDTARQRIVLYRAAADARVETWECDSGAWQKREPAQNPASTFDGALLEYDAGLLKCVLVAEGGSTAAVQTWLWDGANWSQSAGAQPTWALTGGMAYDAVRQQLVLLSTHMQTWVFDGAGWTQKYPAHAPGYLRLGYFALKYDAARQKCSFFSGEGAATAGAAVSYPTTTWDWDGQDWMEFSPGIIVPPSELKLAVERSDAQSIRLSWPADAAGFQLESAPALGAAAQWTTVQEPAQGAPPSVTLPATNSGLYFRLRKP